MISRPPALRAPLQSRGVHAIMTWLRVLVASMVVLAGCDAVFDLELVGDSQPPIGELPAFCADPYVFEDFEDPDVPGCGVAFPFGDVRREDGELVLAVPDASSNAGCSTPERPLTANGIFMRVTQRLEVDFAYTGLVAYSGEESVAIIYNGRLQLHIQRDEYDKRGDLADPPEWWRLRRAGSDVVAETSETGTTWSELARVALPGFGTVVVDFVAGIEPNRAGSGTARFAAFGICR
jgi:hypothetical protein